MLNRIRARIFSVRIELLISYILLVFFIVGTVGLFPYYTYKDIIEKKVSNESINTINQISSNLERLIDDIVLSSNMFYSDSELKNILKKEEFVDLYDEVYTYRRVGEIMQRNTINLYQINCYVDIYDNFGNYYSSWNDNPDSFFLPESYYYKEIQRNEGRIIWDSFFLSVDNSYVYSSIRSLDDIKGNHGVLILSINEKEFFNIYRNLLNEDEDIFIVDSTGTIISSASKDIIGNKMDKLLMANLNSNVGHFVDTINERKVLVTYRSANNKNLFVVRYTDYNVYISEIEMVRVKVTLICVCCVIITSLVAVIVSKHITKPIYLLIHCINTVKTGDFSVRAAACYGNEFDLLAANFNDMVERLSDLILSLQQEKELKRKAELRSLQAQINPHFLYNTLSSVRYLINMGEYEKAESTIISLVKLYRTVVGKGNEMITIREEIEILNSYIYIQNNKYGGKIDLIINVDNEIGGYMIQKLTFQPIVENSIIHGTGSGFKDNIMVKISGYKTKNKIVITLEDNGVGIPDNIASEIFSRNDASKSNKSDLYNGIGLYNINERIKLHFGTECGVCLENLYPGTRVTLTITAEGDRYETFDC